MALSHRCITLTIMQVGAYDCRHSAQALASVCTRMVAPDQLLHVWVYEEAPEVLARHMLLLSILLDTSLPLRQRTELFLEAHSNACIQTATAEYLGKMRTGCLCWHPHLCIPMYHADDFILLPADRQGQMLETVTLDYSAQDPASTSSLLFELFDLSHLRFQQRDDVAEIFRKYSRKVRPAMLMPSLCRCSGHSLAANSTRLNSARLCNCRSPMTCRKHGTPGAGSSMAPDTTSSEMQ